MKLTTKEGLQASRILNLIFGLHCKLTTGIPLEPLCNYSYPWRPCKITLSAKLTNTLKWLVSNSQLSHNLLANDGCTAYACFASLVFSDSMRVLYTDAWLIAKGITQRLMCLPSRLYFSTNSVRLQPSNIWLTHTHTMYVKLAPSRTTWNLYTCSRSVLCQRYKTGTAL